MCVTVSAKMFHYIRPVNIFVLYLSLLLMFCSTVISQTVGQSCLVQGTGRNGHCKEASQCPVELELAKLGLKPTLCERQWGKFIICCADSTNLNAHPFSLATNIDDDDSDVVKFPDEGDAPSFTDNIRISEQKCREYQKYLTDTVKVIPLVTNPKPVSVSVAKCDNSIPLIVGGTPARPGEFPHMAALGYYTDNGIEWKCGGTLISDEFVVTAAHCVKGHRNVVRVRLGETFLSSNLGEKAQEFGIAQVISHPQYHPPQKYNDIALIRLSRAAKLSRFIIPACLRTSFDINEQKAIVTGWGQIDFTGPSSPGLMKVSLTIVSNNECSKGYSKIPERFLSDGIRSTMLCAGEVAGGKDACQGDSGGPLQVARKDNPCMHDIIGITSFGKGCANPNTVGVYTRISEFVPWIERIVWS